MGWSDPELDGVFKIPQNREAIAYLRSRSPSAHSDLAEELIIAGKSMPKYSMYCPNGAACSYLFLHTRSHVIYAVAVGMSTLLLRMPKGQRAAPKSWKSQDANIGKEWLPFNPFNPDISPEAMRENLQSLCRQAYDYALELDPKT